MLQQLLNSIFTGLQFVYKITKYDGAVIGLTSLIALTSLTATTTLTVIKPFFDKTITNLKALTNAVTISQSTRGIVIPVVRTRTAIPRRLRNDVWIKYQGNKNHGMCYCCGTNIVRTNYGWHCSHVIANVKDGELSIDNLRVCCSHCNLSMGSQNLYAYIRDKYLKGPGFYNVANYFRDHPSQIYDKRLNKRSIVTVVHELHKISN